MSATRQAHRTGHDVYLTPAWCVRAILPHLRQYLPAKDQLCMLEPAAGDGAIVQQLVAWSKGTVDCYEIREECRATLQALPACEGRVGRVSILDFLELPSERRACDFDLVVGNPPYRLALDFVQRSLEYVHVDGIVVMLLRLGFLASRKRFEWLSRHVPDIYPLAKRPSFTGAGTDASDYGWFVFRKYQRTAGCVRPLDCK